MICHCTISIPTCYRSISISFSNISSYVSCSVYYIFPFLIIDSPIPIDSPFSIGTINYPANWLRLSTAEEKTAAGIVEVADPTLIDYKFYNHDGSAKSLDDTNATDDDGNLVKI